MDQLREMRTFLSVAETRSFSSAARQLGVSPSTVTKIITGLEQRMGVLLVVRSTHHVTITNAGEIFADEAREILARVDHLHQRIETENSELKGVVIIGTPPAFASTCLVRVINAFRDEHPMVEFRIVADDGTLNVIKEGLDFSIRIARALPDMALISQLLVRVPQILVASPAYLNARERPRHPEDLVHHDCLIHTIKSPDMCWAFDSDSMVTVRGPLSSNLGEALRQSALQGKGISLHPTYMVKSDLRQGRLERVLENIQMEEMSIYAVYAERNFRPQRVLEFQSFLKSWLQNEPDWHALD